MNNSILQNIYPPLFYSQTTNIRIFFARFEIYRNSHRPAWQDNVALNILCNLVDESALNFITTLEEEVRDNYEDVKDALIAYFSPGKPLSMQWEDFIARKQTDEESVVSYCDDLIVLSRNIQMLPETFLNVFILGLRPAIKNYIQLLAAPIDTLGEAVNICKKYQCIMKNKPFHTNVVKPNREINFEACENRVENSPGNENNYLEKLEILGDKIDQITHKMNNTFSENDPFLPDFEYEFDSKKHEN